MCYLGICSEDWRTAKVIDDYLKHRTMTMQCFSKSMILLIFLGFCSPSSIVAQPSSVHVVPPPELNPNFWIISTMQKGSNISLNQGYTTFLPVLQIQNSEMYGTYFGFHTMDNNSFILVIMFSWPQDTIVWSANPDYPVSPSAILTFTGEGDLLLQDGGTLIWSTATKNKSVAGMMLDLSGNLVLFDQNNSSVWQSSDHPTDAQPSSVVPPKFWIISTMQRVESSNNISVGQGDTTFLPVLHNSGFSYGTYFGFYTMDSHSFILAIALSGPQGPIVWSANPDNPVSQTAVLSFTTEGDLLLQDGGTLIWSTATKNKSVAGMMLDLSGNLVLFDQNNSSVWQSFDHPTDTLVMGQSLCRGMKLSAKLSSPKWSSSRFYLSAEWNGLQHYFEPAAYTQLFPSMTASTCYALTNGSLGFPDKIFSLPSASSLQFMRLESDGHLGLYEMQENNSPRMLFDVLSSVIAFCDYPLACGDYGVCSSGQCSCPSFSTFRFQNERLPGAGCVPLSVGISCEHAHGHKLIPLNNISYFSYSSFLKLATLAAAYSESEEDCKQSCLMNCSCQVVIFHNYPGTGFGYCLLLSEQMVILFADDSSNQFSAFVKIQDNPPEKKMVIIVASCTAAGFSLMSIFVCAVIWKRRKKDEELLFHGILGTPKRFSFDELKITTGNFSMKLGHGGFGSVFKGRIGKETIAVKRLEGVEQGTEEFLAEVKTIGRMHHRNLVRLVGFCAEKSHKLLVYEYLPNGSLDKWIFHTSPIFSLSWRTRRNIIIAIARGLAFLHEECKEKIAHLDIKPQNILLDDEFNAKLSDFGLSKMINRDQSKVMTRMRGTRGYLAPEWLGSKITEKADIYSFGVVMIEIICGRENLDESQPEESIHLISLLQEKARSGQLSDLVDTSSNDMKFHMEEVMQTMKLAMWCLQVDSSARPLMSTVAKVLEGVKSLDATPDCTFVPNFASSNIGVAESRSSYVPCDSHLSGPR